MARAGLVGMALGQQGQHLALPPHRGPSDAARDIRPGWGGVGGGMGTTHIPRDLWPCGIARCSESVGNPVGGHDDDLGPGMKLLQEPAHVLLKGGMRIGDDDPGAAPSPSADGLVKSFTKMADVRHSLNTSLLAEA